MDSPVAQLSQAPSQVDPFDRSSRAEREDGGTDANLVASELRFETGTHRGGEEQGNQEN
jgi:hypothetical protein